MSVSLFGIRHHGPGSARSLLRALRDLKPDAVLVEGPPEAEPLLPLLAQAEMQPPVAILIYGADNPRRATFFPLAIFSPEWQAIRYAAERSLPLRFIDLPQSIEFAIAEELEKTKLAKTEAEAASPDAPVSEANAEKQLGQAETDRPQTDQDPVREDPLNWLARAAGFSDGESWWEHMVEHRQEGDDIFAAISEAMTQLRQEMPRTGTTEYLLREDRREAHMRQSIRSAEQDFQNVAVVCGAWHVPALGDLPAKKKEDAALLRAVPKSKVKATCIPWTHSRLRLQSGYKAGVDSPGWYHHLWTAKNRPVIRWLTKVARLLRKEDLDASSAHIIEAVRLAETLAAVRDRPLPGLSELNEASVAVLCHGDALPMRLIHDKLIVGDQLGSVPAETPTVPLQQDVANEQRRLRLKPETGVRNLDLDLRTPNDLARSHLLHRLRLLGIGWGDPSRAQRAKGTFHELWAVSWEPEFEITLIERGAWGNTLLLASSAYAKHLADDARELSVLTEIIQNTLLAELPEAAAHAVRRLQQESALANDVAQLMAAVPALVNAVRYGTVRNTEVGMLAGIVRGLVTRVCVGLPTACLSLDDAAAAKMFDHIIAVNTALANLQDSELTSQWQAALTQLASQDRLHGLLAGRCMYLLFAAGATSVEEAARPFSLALSAAVDPAYSAAWCEGFLRGSGTLLVHDERMLQILDEWVASLSSEHFMQQLATLRRTFSTFHAPERRQIGERIKQGGLAVSPRIRSESFDEDRAARALPLLAQLLGLHYDPQKCDPENNVPEKKAGRQ
jgi:hypothetical protein